MPAYCSNLLPDIAMDYHTMALNDSAVKIIDKHAEMYADVCRVHAQLATAAVRLGTGCPGEVLIARDICLQTMRENG